MMTNDDHKGRIFLSHSYANNGFFFLHISKYDIFIFKEKTPKVPQYAGMQHIT